MQHQEVTSVVGNIDYENFDCRNLDCGSRDFVGGEFSFILYENKTGIPIFQSRVLVLDMYFDID